jgi:hypothetical protein
MAIVLAVCAPMAPAAAPANDDFDARLVLSNPLPIQVAGTNVEASKQTGEPNHNGFSAAGHSVWFEWEATSTGLVTIGACDSDFRALVGIYTGTTVESLTRIASGNASEGPNCLYSGGEFTFKAMSGTSYKIAVDGDGFGFPEGPPPVSEGQLALRIEATPRPANDDFDQAAILAGPITEEPDGNRFYSANLTGSNWGATEEGGEPDHAGDPGGASVWYAWTAPETGIAQVSVCCGGPDLLGIYTGADASLLTPLGAGRGFTQVPVAGGATYRIAVDGERGGTGEAEVGSFTIRATMKLARRELLALPKMSVPPPLDRVAPKTTISRTNVKPLQRMASFRFGSNEPVSFSCKLDSRPFAACGSPKTYRGLKAGRHTFRVVAEDRVGNRDRSPAVVHFGIPKPKPHKGKA